MTRSGAPFHGAHGEGRSAISPAASHSGAEPCAHAFPAARARTNAPVISDNAVVAVPINWRAESTGNPLPLSSPGTQSAEIMAKVDRPSDFGCAGRWNSRLAQTRLAAWEWHQLRPMSESGRCVDLASGVSLLIPTFRTSRARAGCK